MKLRTALIAVGVSAVSGVILALLLTITPAVIYIYTGITVTP